MYVSMKILYKTETHDENGNEAGECGVPVSACCCSFSNEHAVEDEVTEAELHSSCRGTRHILMHSQRTSSVLRSMTQTTRTHCLPPAHLLEMAGTAESQAPPSFRSALPLRLKSQRSQAVSNHHSAL